MNQENILVEQSGGVATITVNRPAAHNILDREALRDLHAAVRSVAEQETRPRALILTGSGDEAFIGGLDPAELVRLPPEEGLAYSELGQQTCNLLDSMPVPTIAAVNGIAIGGGCELAMACDLTYASTHASFTQIEVLAGLLPGFGGSYRLSRRVGTMRARRMIYSAEVVDAHAALGWGLALEVVEPERLLGRCREVAAEICRNGAEAVAEAKRILTASGELTLSASNALERRAFAARFGTQEMQERMTRVVEEGRSGLLEGAAVPRG